MSERRISVAVIGAGISGLAAIKEFVNAGFEVVAFEKNDSVAGLWAYSDDPQKRSVGWHTMINSSKYMVHLTKMD
jgi:dimethylaniline monooxygenase (N-oxide forming)